MYESRAYDRPNDFGFDPDPVVVLVVTGTHDVSRLVNLLNGGTAVIEQIEVGQRLARQVAGHNAGRAALNLLKAHGGPDLLTALGTTEPTPTVSDELRALADELDRRGRERSDVDSDGPECDGECGNDDCHTVSATATWHRAGTVLRQRAEELKAVAR